VIERFKAPETGAGSSLQLIPRLSPSAALPAACWSLAGILLIAVVGLYALYAIAALRFPWGLDYSEGLIWQQVLWTPGPHWYGDITHYPFVVFEYPPVYMLVVKAVAALGVPMLAAGRAVAIAATLAACGLLGAIVWRTARSICNTGAAPALAGIGAACLPLSLAPVLSWSILMRVDMLALAFTYLGLALGAAALRRRALLYPAVLAFVAAVFTKQIYLAGAFSLGVVWLIRAPRQAILAYGAGGLVGLAAVSGLGWITGGGFIRHIFLYNVDRVDAAIAVRQAWRWIAAYPVFAALVPAGLVLVWREALAERRWRGLAAMIRSDDSVALLAVLTAYLMLTTVMLVSAGKIGASRNYFIEWMCAWCLWIGLLAAVGLNRLRTVAQPIWLLVPLCLVLQLGPVPPALAAIRRAEFSAERARQAVLLLARMRELKGPILSDDMALVIQSGREVGAEPGILLELAQNGVWDEMNLVRMLQGRQFAAVITAYDPGDPTFDARYLPRTQAAMLAAYPHVEKFGDLRLRLP
jgi:hypothetical protein